MTPGSTGLNERAVAGRPSVTRLTQSRATGLRTWRGPEDEEKLIEELVVSESEILR